MVSWNWDKTVTKVQQQGRGKKGSQGGKAKKDQEIVEYNITLRGLTWDFVNDVQYYLNTGNKKLLSRGTPSMVSRQDSNFGEAGHLESSETLTEGSPDSTTDRSRQKGPGKGSFSDSENEQEQGDERKHDEEYAKKGKEEDEDDDNGNDEEKKEEEQEEEDDEKRQQKREEAGNEEIWEDAREEGESNKGDHDKQIPQPKLKMKEQVESSVMETANEEVGNMHEEIDGAASLTHRDIAQYLPPVDDFQWFRCEGKTSTEFDEDESEQLEKYYQSGDKSLLCSGYLVNFSSMIATSTNDPLFQYKVVRWELISEKKGEKRPAEWTDKVIEDVQKKSDEYKKIARTVIKSVKEIDAGHYSPFIVKIQRIQNGRLLNRFSRYKSKNKGKKEIVMWQKVEKEFKEGVTEYGCQKAYCMVKCDELGDGLCFSSEVKDCIEVEDIDEDCDVCLVRCLVYLDEDREGKGRRHLRFPPIDERSKKPFCSVANETFSMVFNSTQVLPTHFVMLGFQ